MKIIQTEKRKGPWVFRDRGPAKETDERATNEVKRKPVRCEARKEKSSCLCSALWRNCVKARKKSLGLATRKSQSHWSEDGEMMTIENFQDVSVKGV